MRTGVRLPVAAGGRGEGLGTSRWCRRAGPCDVAANACPPATSGSDSGPRRPRRPCAPDGSFTFLNVPCGSSTRILAQASVMDFTTGSATRATGRRPRGSQAAAFLSADSRACRGSSYLSRQGQNLPVWGRASITVGTAANRQSGREDAAGYHDSAAASCWPMGVLAPANSSELIILGATGERRSEPRSANRVHVPHRSQSNVRIGRPRWRHLRHQHRLRAIRAGLGAWPTAATSLTLGFDASLGRDFDNVIVTITDRVAGNQRRRARFARSG